ncbi:hypothetical protein HYW17_05655 [Candidatus Uhrbacteria bacterium]|nr:hypothetical protein [Candidatus Uhrbacteria bacterium]
MKISTNWFSRGSKISGCASILGSWQICHNVCTSLIALVATFGIALQGMPLLFLNRFQWPLWIAAVVLFGVLLFIRAGMRMRCITTRGVFGNAGLLLAGLPFAGEWVAGARTVGLVLVLGVLGWYLKDLIVKRVETGWVVDFVEQGKKVAGGLVGVVAVVGLFFATHNPSQPPLILRGGDESDSPLRVRGDRGVTSQMKFTLFDIAQAKELMDKNGDGACDACGMAIDQCIESGMMECTMDPDAKIGLLQSAHIHAEFHVLQNGKELDLTPYGHRMGGNDDGKSSSFLHVEGPNFNRLHMHATGVPLKFWFDSMGLTYDPKHIKVVVGGASPVQGLDYVFKDGDIIEVKL